MLDFGKVDSVRARVDPIGKVLLKTGALNQESLADVLDQQRHTLPLASLCYALGYADEETLARALSKQCGLPGVVLDRGVIKLDVLEGVQREVAMYHNMLPMFEDERRIFVAAVDPAKVREVLRELEFVRGKTLVPHIALHVTLARTIRAAYSARGRGEEYHFGNDAGDDEPGALGSMVVVSDVDTIDDTRQSAAHSAVIEDVTKELVDVDLILMEASDTGVDSELSTADGDPFDTRHKTYKPDSHTPLSSIELVPQNPSHETIDLDEGDSAAYIAQHEGPSRVLLVDDDFATRHLLVKELQPLGLVTATASSGGEAVRAIKSLPPDIVVIDVMLPEIDGFQVCRAIKQSRKYNHIPVILMSAVIDSGRVTDDVLRRYGADAYFEKPLNTDRVKRRITDLLRASGESELDHHDDSFQSAIELYKAGDIDGAVQQLRDGLLVDPLSAKHHFVLANLLQKSAQIYEAIDEYEATVDLKPDYFPALTRLAYLYYKKGFSAKAIEMWRRSLPHCNDANLRKNIEVFMRKLIADMQSEV